MICISFSLLSAENTEIKRLKARAEAHLDIQEIDEAISAYKQVLEIDPNEIEALFNIASIYQMQGKFEEAVKYSEMGMKIESDKQPFFYSGTGNLYDLLGDYDKAVEIYLEGIEKFPKAEFLHSDLGIVYLSQQKEKMAESEFIKTIEINPLYSAAHYLLGEIYMSQEKGIPAVLAFSYYLILEPVSDNAGDAVLNILEMFDYYSENRSGRDDESIFSGIEKKFAEKITPLEDLGSDKKLTISIMKSNFDLLFGLFNEIDTDSDDFAARFYVPFCWKLKENGYTELFVYLLFQTPDLTLRDFSVERLKKNVTQVKEFMKLFFEHYGMVNPNELKIDE